MENFLALLALFRKGSEVANPAAWKTGQVTVNAVGGLLLAVAAVAKVFFGVSLPLTDADSLTIGGGIIAVVNLVVTVVSSKRAGV